MVLWHLSARMVTLWLVLVATTVMTKRIDVTNFGVRFWDLNDEGVAAGQHIHIGMLDGRRKHQMDITWLEQKVIMIIVVSKFAHFSFLSPFYVKQLSKISWSYNYSHALIRVSSHFVHTEGYDWIYLETFLLPKVWFLDFMIKKTNRIQETAFLMEHFKVTWKGRTKDVIYFCFKWEYSKYYCALQKLTLFLLWKKMVRHIIDSYRLSSETLRFQSFRWDYQSEAKGLECWQKSLEKR